MINWHRLFGAVLYDFFTDSPYQVELEKDLALKQQFLDVVVIHKTNQQPITQKNLQLPDGFDNLATHNLITFKSHQEALNKYALFELYGHFINYTKQTSTKQQPVDFDNCQLYAVCTRLPEKLMAEGEFTPLQVGVYDYTVLGYTTRIIVTSQMHNHARNAIWQLFSGNQTQFTAGAKHYGVHNMRHNELMRQLFRHYQQEALFPMAYSFEQFEKDLHEETLKSLTEQEILQAMQLLPIEKQLQNIPIAQRLEGVPLEQRLEGVPIEQLLEVVPVEQRLEGIPLEKRLEGLTPEEIQKMLAELQKRR